MSFDPANPVIALCAAGMQVDGVPDEARALFEQAWAIRVDDFDASVAAHFLARHQSSAADTLHWNEVALRHADALTDDRVHSLLPSLCLNLADSYLTAERIDDARVIADRATRALEGLPEGGYTELVRGGIARLHARLAERSSL